MPVAGRRAVLVLVLAGAVVVLAAATRTWARASLDTGLPGLSDVAVGGRAAGPAAIPVALAAGAAAVVLAICGRTVRIAVSAGLVLAGGLLAAATVRTLLDGQGLIATGLVEAVGIRGGLFWSTDDAVRVTPWGWVAVAGALMLVAGGLLGLRGGPGWPGPARRYERPAGDPAGDSARTGGGRRADRPDGRPGPGVADDRGGASRADRPVARDNGPVAAWDALSRGEDPTSDDEDPT